MKYWLSWALGLAVMLLVLVWGFSQWNLKHYTDLVGERLELLGELRRGAVEEYLATAEAELHFWSTTEDLVEAQQNLNAIWGSAGESVAPELYRLYVEENPNPPGYLLNLDDAGDGGDYSLLHGRLHESASLFVTQRGYYDLFLIGPGGDVYYTVEKESDFTANLETGPLKDSGLAEAFIAAKRGQKGRVIAFSDMRPYAPSDNAPAIFMATALHDRAGEFIGVLALQLPTDRILGIMAYTSGMGKSGETYLVGGDKLMRSDSRFSADSTILTQRVDTETANAALAGEQGREWVTDYRGTEVMSAYTPLKVGKTTWAVLAEMDRTEIKQIAARERPALTAPLLLIYGLSLWSVWYWRGRRLPEEGVELSDVDFSDSSGGDLGA